MHINAYLTLSDPARVLLLSQHGCSNFDLEALGRLTHHHSSNAPKVWQVKAMQQVLADSDSCSYKNRQGMNANIMVI